MLAILADGERRTGDVQEALTRRGFTLSRAATRRRIQRLLGLELIEALPPNNSALALTASGRAACHEVLTMYRQFDHNLRESLEPPLTDGAPCLRFSKVLPDAQQHRAEVAMPHVTLTLDELKVLTELRAAPLVAKELRERLRQANVEHARGTFTRTMQRLCRRGLVKSEEIERGPKGGNPQKRYELTLDGDRERQAAVAFYQRELKQLETMVSAQDEQGRPTLQPDGA